MWINENWKCNETGIGANLLIQHNDRNKYREKGFWVEDCQMLETIKKKTTDKIVDDNKILKMWIKKQ